MYFLTQLLFTSLVDIYGLWFYTKDIQRLSGDFDLPSWPIVQTVLHVRRFVQDGETVSHVGKGTTTHLPVYSDGCGSTCCFRFFADTRGNSTRHFSSLGRCDRGCIWRFCRLYCLVGLFASDSSGWIEHNSQLEKKSWKHAFTRVLTPSGPGTPCCLDSPFPAVDTVVSSNFVCSVSDSRFYSAFFPAQSKSTRAREHQARPWQLRERRCRRVAPLDFLPTSSFHSFQAVSASNQCLIQFDYVWYSAEYRDLWKRLSWFKKSCILPET